MVQGDPQVAPLLLEYRRAVEAVNESVEEANVAEEWGMKVADD